MGLSAQPATTLQAQGRDSVSPGTQDAPANSPSTPATRCQSEACPLSPWNASTVRLSHPHLTPWFKASPSPAQPEAARLLALSYEPPEQRVHTTPDTRHPTIPQAPGELAPAGRKAAPEYGASRCLPGTRTRGGRADATLPSLWGVGPTPIPGSQTRKPDPRGSCDLPEVTPSQRQSPTDPQPSAPGLRSQPLCHLYLSLITCHRSLLQDVHSRDRLRPHLPLLTLRPDAPSNPTQPLEQEPQPSSPLTPLLGPSPHTATSEPGGMASAWDGSARG